MPNLVTSWSEAQRSIRAQIGEIAYTAWFGPLKVKSFEAETLTIEVPDAFFKDWFASHYRELVDQSLQKIIGRAVTVEFVVNPSLVKKENKSKLQVFESRMKEQAGDEVHLSPKNTFENFVVGPSNRFTHAACFAVAENPAKSYNPLFIYGGVGLGKTHLMQAICHFAKRRDPRTLIKYVTSETFTNELITAIHRHSMNEFRKKYRSLDILLIDDIHFIAGKESTQEEFFHTFNALKDSHKQIIISSDRPPREISKLEERLISRFSWGLITDIQPPDLETRIAILRKKLEPEKTNIPDDVLMFIAQSITKNIRELEGALIRLIAYAVLENKTINLTLARDILKDMLRETSTTITVPGIQKKVADHFNVQVLDFKSKRRNKNIVFARQIAMFLSRELTNLSLPEIGLHFGGKDHTTVLHSYNKIKTGCETTSHIKNTINQITTELKNNT